MGKMTKQEEIQKRIWEILDDCANNPAVDTVGIILSYLDSQGVVFKGLEHRMLVGYFNVESLWINTNI